MYKISFIPGEFSSLDIGGLDGKDYGVSHADELFFFWNPFFYQNYTLNQVPH